MSHFQLDSAIQDSVRMDAPIQKGPMMRWQRKALESGVRTLSLSDAVNDSRGLSPRRPKSANPLTMKLTPNKKTPNTPTSARPSKTPSKTPTSKFRLRGKTPNKNTPTSKPGAQGASDRFIPNRTTTEMDISHYRLLNNEENEDPLSPNKIEYQRKLDENVGEQNAKILSFKQKAPQAKEGHISSLKVLYSAAKTTAPKSTSTRFIPQQAERVLDAPELLNDYYLNLLHWSANNHLVVALGGAVYIWDASDGSISQLFEIENQDEYVSSVQWIKEGNILAVGISTGAVQLWDVGAQKLVRTMTGHAARVGSLAWNAYILSSGCRSGAIHHHDVRVANHHIGTLANHSQEVCGLAWSPDGRHLGSGGNDNLVNIWGATMQESASPIHTFTQHLAAVKALSWCPWQPSLLATGGGTADRCINFWNITTGSMLASTDTNSQVCSIVWNKDYKELLSGHGFSQNQLTIWKYPSMVRVAELTGHSARVLSLALSPDGTTVASAAADETIRLWKCFAVDKTKKSVCGKVKDSGHMGKAMLMRGSIR
ncbi:unnamed protein product [Owenia fusiformis]|uniref:CDC20/Fizzy WD40 domain-containing protein n=1 Tax=Owenia fusiformis TaxID=6347 RepID=A0A8J1V158_OWEFU|nr:unnamed protein product [Owenia fusiformis]